MNFQNASEFADFIVGLGFRVWLDKTKKYGFISDKEGNRVVTFSFSYGSSLAGTYGPPSQTSGTGWVMEETLYDLRTKEDVEKVLTAHAPSWCGNGWKYYASVKDHLALCGDSSGYKEVTS